MIAAGLSWKKSKKLLARASTEKREAYIQLFSKLYEEVVLRKRTLIYVDEAHIHQDVDLGYGWTGKGERFFVPSVTPGLFSKINWYGAYDFSNGRTLAWAYKTCNGSSTVEFLD